MHVFLLRISLALLPAGRGCGVLLDEEMLPLAVGELDEFPKPVKHGSMSMVKASEKGVADELFLQSSFGRGMKE